MIQEAKLFDYHTHTLEHGFNKSPQVERTIQAAINLGMSEICLTDHYPLPPDFVDPTEKQSCAIPLSLYPAYQDRIAKAKEQFGKKITILVGAEFDWLPTYQNWTREQLLTYPFDYTIGSVHFLGEIENTQGKRNFLIDYSEEEFRRGIEYFGGIRQLVEAYYRQIQAMAKSQLFDSVGHIDLVKKFNSGDLFSENEPWYRELVLETLDVMTGADMTLELNASGLDKKCNAPYPSLWILEESLKRNIPLTIGSDGHMPETIGRNLNRATDIARAAGYNSFIHFQQRRRIFYVR